MYWSFPALDTSCSVSCVSYYHTSVLVNIDKTAVCQAALCKWECCMEGSPGIIMLGGESFCSEELSLWRQEDLTLEGKGLEKQPRICVMGFSLLWVVWQVIHVCMVLHGGSRANLKWACLSFGKSSDTKTTQGFFFLGLFSHSQTVFFWLLALSEFVLSSLLVCDTNRSWASAWLCTMSSGCFGELRPAFYFYPSERKLTQQVAGLI